MAMMEPDVAVLDETDSGLDIDALRRRRRRHRRGAQATGPQLGILLITHYQRILDHLTPDVVHVLLDGRIVATGGPELARTHRGRGLRRVPGRGGGMSDEHTLDVAAHQGRLPDPQARRSTASGSSTSTPRRRRRSRSRCSTRWTTTTASTTPTSTAACTRSPRRRPPRSRPPAPRSPASSTRAHAHEIVFVRNATEAINLVAYSLGPRQPARGRRDRAHAHGAPRQRRAVAHARRRARHRAALDPAHRRLPARPHRPRPAARRRQAARGQRDVERARHHQRHPPARRRRARAPARSCSSTRARPCPTSPSTCRPGTPTSSPSPPTRCSARPASARCGHAASCSRRCRRSSAAAR